MGWPALVSRADVTAMPDETEDLMNTMTVALGVMGLG